MNELKAPSRKNPDYKDLYNRTACVVFRNCNKNWPFFVNISKRISRDINHRRIPRPKEYPALCYIQKGKINYKKFIQDEMFFIENLVLNKSIIGVSLLKNQS